MCLTISSSLFILSWLRRGEKHLPLLQNGIWILEVPTVTLCKFSTALSLSFSTYKMKFVAQLILNIYRSCICEFICLQGFVCNPRMNTHSPLESFVTLWGAMNNLSHLTGMFPAKFKHGETLPSGFRPRCKQGVFRSTLGHGFAFLWFLLVTLPFNMTPKHNGEVLPGVLKHKKAATCSTETDL